ncbi:MAG TPA: SIS domain-containing protein, partial [Pseudonocardia sp.]|nr:SIS domain-containing protein [Pseudonocardia sp.]
MTDLELTPFERDIAEQPHALRRLADAPLPDLRAVTSRNRERIVLTGMGSSHFAGTPTWRHLISQGRPAWAIDTGQLLDDEALVTPGTLLVATSQSGASGEIAELLRRRRNGRISPAAVIGITDDATSPLAEGSDVVLPLHSGPEATVSTKSYLNTLAVHRMLRAAFAGQDVGPIQRTELRAAAAAVQTVLEDTPLRAELTDVAQASAAHPSRRLSYLGTRDTAATAFFASLITKESAKIAAEGYAGGQFRHGPFELAGDGHTAVLFFPDDNRADPSLRRLAADLLAAGSHVVTLDADADAVKATTPITVPGAPGL